jgi:hypothetical protein
MGQETKRETQSRSAKVKNAGAPRGGKFLVSGREPPLVHVAKTHGLDVRLLCSG